MKLTIDESVCHKYKMSLEEVLMALMYKHTDNPTETYNNLINREVVVVHNGKHSVTQHWSEVLDEILADSQGNERTEDELMELAGKMREIYPPGRMLDRRTGQLSPYIFRCNRAEVTKKLKTFFARYGNFSDEEILDAEKRYVASYRGNYQQAGFRLLKYFIWKDNPKQGPDGNYVESISPLLDFLENKDEEEVINDEDWTTTVV